MAKQPKEKIAYRGCIACGYTQGPEENNRICIKCGDKTLPVPCVKLNMSKLEKTPPDDYVAEVGFSKDCSIRVLTNPIA